MAVPTAAAVRVTFVAAMERIFVPARMPGPVTVMPSARPAVFVTAITVAPLANVERMATLVPSVAKFKVAAKEMLRRDCAPRGAMLRATLFPTKVRLLVPGVTPAPLLMVTVLPTIAVMVSPAGRLVPVTLMPTRSPAVLTPVIWGELAVVVPFVLLLETKRLVTVVLGATLVPVTAMPTVSKENWLGWTAMRVPPPPAEAMKVCGAWVAVALLLSVMVVGARGVPSAVMVVPAGMPGPLAYIPTARVGLVRLVRKTEFEPLVVKALVFWKSVTLKFAAGMEAPVGAAKVKAAGDEMGTVLAMVAPPGLAGLMVRTTPAAKGCPVVAMAVIVAPAGIPGPLIACPTLSPEVLPMVTTFENPSVLAL